MKKRAKVLSVPTINDYLYKISQQKEGYREGGLRCKNFYNNRSESGSPLVSIVTIVYNGEKHLDDTIQSVLNQTYDKIEYIIVDGGSTDQSLDIIKKYEDRIAYWRSEKDGGISDAFNKGISLSNGDVIGIINADDRYEHDTVEKIAKLFSNKSADIIHGDIRRGSQLMIPDQSMLNYEMSINHPSTFVSRLSYLKIGLFRNDFKYTMDYEWLLRAKNNGLRFLYLNQCLVNMRTGGISDRKWLMVIWERLYAQKIHYPNRLIFNYLFFLFQVVKGTISRLLNMVGLKGIVKYYHVHISMVKKRNVI